jgi:hypothetical protein
VYEAADEDGCREDSGQKVMNGTEAWQLVCTREQFEAYGREKEQEGEKWTHIVDDDNVQLTRCRKHLELCNGGGWVYVCEKGEYFVPDEIGYCGVKPIKPTLTKAQMLERIKYRAISIDDDDEFGAKVREWLENYDITD